MKESRCGELDSAVQPVTVPAGPLRISLMDLIITGGVRANEQSPSIHLLNLFQFLRGSVAVGREKGCNDYFFFLVVINYVTY